MKWVIILGILGIIILTLSLVASRRYLLRAPGRSGKRARRPTETEEQPAATRLIHKSRDLPGQLPTENRSRRGTHGHFSVDAEDLTAVQVAMRSSASGAMSSSEPLQAEVRAQLEQVKVHIDEFQAAMKAAEGGIRSTSQFQEIQRRVSQLRDDITSTRRKLTNAEALEALKQLEEAVERNSKQLEEMKDQVGDSEVLNPIGEKFSDVMKMAEGGIHSSKQLEEIRWRMSGLRDRIRDARGRVRSSSGSEKLRELEQAAERNLRRLEGMKDEISDSELVGGAVATFNVLMSKVKDGIRSRAQLEELVSGMRGLRSQLPDLERRVRSTSGREALKQLSEAINKVLSQAQVQRFLAGVEERQPREIASSEREKLRAKVEESAARMTSAPADAAFLGGREEDLISLAEFVLERYAWALDPSQVSLLTSLVNGARGALQDADRRGLEQQIGALDQATDNLPEIVRVFLALCGAIARVQAAEPNLAAKLSEQLDAVESACRVGDPAWEGKITALAQEVQQAAQVQMQLTESKTRRCSTCGASLPPGQRFCPGCGSDAWLVAARSAKPGEASPPAAPRNRATPAPAGSTPIAIAPRERQGNAEMPVALTDRVHFSVAAPDMVAPGTAFIVDVWAHLERQRAEVIRRIHESVKGGEIIAEKGPIQIARGTILTVRLRAEDLTVEDAEDTILWEGEIGKASFPVKVPAKAAEGEKSATATFHVDGLQVAKLHFTLTVGTTRTAAETLPARQTRYRTAFASYATKDRDEVLNIIQGIQKGVPGLDVFLDVASLRAGEKWEDRLRAEICARDVFYLFWSEAARQSPWVQREWRCAYENRGVDFIDPVPLVSPETVPPPQELAELHFNDWVLAFKRRATHAPN